jgi:UDP-N-acetylglucosamine 2-epimerase (non-hydrolysing)
MVRPVAQFFDFGIDHDFAIMKPGQSLNHITSATIAAMDEVLRLERPDWCVVQGDTSTTFAAALAAFHSGARIAHVEAGLRTGDMRSPWPEEANRVLTTRIADLHFAPTALAASALLAEGVSPDRVHDVGNTVVDAAREAARIVEGDQAAMDARFGDLSGRSVLFTMHRRENIGRPMEDAFAAAAALADAGARIVFPMHPNPLVREPATRILGGRDDVVLCEPLEYPALIHVLRSCRFVLTDSGGIVEEAASFSKPALVLRESTERSESVESGGAVLVGTDPHAILSSALPLMEDGPLHASMSAAVNPFGDGRSSDRIVETLARWA